jgi:S1-C subfamily serine protease
MIGLNELATLTPDRARDRGIPWVPGVLVVSAAPGAAIQAGDVIRSVSNESVSSLEDLYTRIRTVRNRTGRSFSGTNVPLLLGVEGSDGQIRNLQIPLR